MSDDINDRVQHAQEQNRHANAQSDVSIGMEGDGDSGALSKSRDMLREHNELASNASEQMLQQDDAMIDDEIRSGNGGVAEDILNNGLGQAGEQNQLPSQPEPQSELPEPQPEPVPESQSESPVPQPEQNGGADQPNNDGAGLSRQEVPSSAEEVPQGSVSTSNYIEDNNQINVGQNVFNNKSVTPVSEPVTPAPESTPASTPAPDTSGRSDYLMRQADRIEQHANISDITANKGDRNMMRQGVLHQMDKRTLVHDTGVAGRLQGDKKTALLSHNNKLAADIRDSARTQSKLTAIYSKTHQNAGEAYRRANKLRQAAQQFKLQHAPNPVTPGPVKPKPVTPNPLKPNPSNPNSVTPKKLEPKKLEPKKDNPQMETPNNDFGPHIPQPLGIPKTFDKSNAPAKPKPKPKAAGKDKDSDWEDRLPKSMPDGPFLWGSKNLGPLFVVPLPGAKILGKGAITAEGMNDPKKVGPFPNPLMQMLDMVAAKDPNYPAPFVWKDKPFGPVIVYPLSPEDYNKGVDMARAEKLKVEKLKANKDKVDKIKADKAKADKAKSKDKVAKPKNDNSTAKKRLDALNDRLDDGRRASHQASNGVSYC